jgi:hypothetical protein
LFEYKGSLSASSFSIAPKLAFPTPTITIERGRSLAFTISSIVA